MPGFKNISIKHKLIIIQFLTAFIAVLICATFFLYVEIKLYKASEIQNKEDIAEIIGTNSIAALIFNDNGSATNMLSLLKDNSSILNVALLDKSGKEFARYTKAGEEIFLFPVTDLKGYGYASQKFLERKFLVRYPIFQGQEHIGTLLLRVQLNEFGTILTNFSKTAALILIISTFSALLISNFLQRIITNRLFSLVAKTKDVAETGNYAIRVDVAQKDEIGVLEIGFNNLLEQIGKTQKELKEINLNLDERVKQRTAELTATQTSLQLSEEKYRKIIEEVGDVVYTSDYKGYFTYINPVSKRLTGYTESEMIGKHFTELIDPEWKEKVVKYYKEQFDNKINETLYSFPIITKSGEKKWVEQTVIQLRAGDRITGHQAVVRDVTERIKIEKEIEKKSEELAASNLELEQFAYVASHDLQEPLRTIANFVGLLDKKYSGKTDQDAQQYFTFVTNATSKMQNLIKDLLEYSRVGRNMKFDQVNCNDVLTGVIAGIDVSIKESNAKITFSKLPVLKGNEIELGRLFQNLINNAIKFRKKNSTPEISITVQEKEKEYLFAIKDNGIGIDEKHINKLFIIFQRLHTDAEYPGTGIGLATCKKIVALHGGKIWVESKLAEGSTFYFTLPK